MAPFEKAQAAPGDEREAFESWARHQSWIKDCQRCADGRYGHWETEKAWAAWQARVALAAAPQAPAAPSDEQLLSEWDRVSGITKATERRLACMRAVLMRWGSAAPAAPAVDATEEHAAEYNRWIKFHAAGDGDYDDFLRREIAAQAKEGGEACE